MIYMLIVEKMLMMGVITTIMEVLSKLPEKLFKEESSWMENYF